MLRAMKEQLKLLALDYDGKFHLNLRDRVGKRATAILDKRLKQAIVLMPDIVEHIFFHWRAEGVSSQVKNLGSYLLTYLYLPKNFIPQSDWGLFGYLDDAYLVGVIYIMVIDQIQDHGGKLKVAEIALYDQVKMLVKDIRLVIPKETKQIDSMLQGLLNNKKEIFFGLVNN